jgi:hypothetical protein
LRRSRRDDTAPIHACACGYGLNDAAFGRNRVLECGDLSPLWIFLSAFDREEKESGDKSPHSKMLAGKQEIAK